MRRIANRQPPSQKLGGSSFCESSAPFTRSSIVSVHKEFQGSRWNGRIRLGSLFWPHITRLDRAKRRMALAHGETMNAFAFTRNRMSARTVRCTLVGIAVLGMGLLAAAPANASPDSFGFSIGFSNCAPPVRCAPAPPPRPVCPPPSWQSREYQRGLDAGCADGSRQGFDDGLWGRRFCAEPASGLWHSSRPCREGYINGFNPSYAAAFERGRCSRPCPPPRPVVLRCPPPRMYCR